MDSLLYQSAVKMAEAIQAKDVSSVELVTAAIQQIETVNPKINAVVQLAAESALEQAQNADEALAQGEIKGALHGVPMTIKDSFDTANIISTGGTLGRKDHIPTTDATVVARLKSAGTILLGKTNTPELTLSPETDNLIYGQTKNPYDLERTPGGSSGGAASIIAAGGVPFDIGTDYGGSIRTPAHFCGIAGIKPTSGRVPRTGNIIPFGVSAVDSFQQAGPLARYVEDLSLILPIISGIDGHDPNIMPVPLGDPDAVDVQSLRIAFHADNGIITPTPEVRNVVHSAATILLDSGAVVEEKRPDDIEKTFEMRKLLSRGDGGAWIKRLLDQYGTDEPTPSLSRYGESPVSSVVDYTKLIADWDQLKHRMLRFMQSYDAILCPVNAFPAPYLGTLLEPDNYLGISYVAAYNLLGYPAVVIRAGTSPEGLPIGVQIVTSPWREDVALAIAAHLESALGTWQPPDLS